MGLTREQKHVLSTILAVAHRVGATPKERKAAVETAIVETGITNPSSPGADSGTSIGWRQETSSSYPNVNRTDVAGAAKRFFSETRQVRDKYSRAGDLAQAVQRSAYGSRYSDHAGEAQSLLRKYEGGGGKGRVRSVSPQTESVAPATTVPTSDVGGPSGADLAAVTQLLNQPAQTAMLQPATPITPPFTARANLRDPRGISPSIPSNNPVTQPDQSSLDATLQAIQALGVNTSSLTGDQAAGPAAPSSAPSAAGRSSSASALHNGTVKVAPGADRAGVSTQPIVKKFVSLVSGRTRHPVTITTGTNHNQMTVNGNVSDHWSGHAADIGVPVDSHQGDVIASAALQLAGVPQSKARQMVRQGGLWTLTPSKGPLAGKRVQVIWRTDEGGNHHNHVHLGIR